MGTAYRSNKKLISLSPGLVVSSLFVLAINILSWKSLSPVPALLFLVLSILLTWQYFDFVRYDRDIEHIVFFPILIIYIQAVEYPGLAFSRGIFRTWYFAGNQVDFFWGLLVWVVGCGAFILGLRSIRPMGQTLLARARLPERKPIRMVCPLMILSLLASLQIIKEYGGLKIMLAGNVASDSVRLSRGIGVYTLFQSMSYIAVGYLGWQAYLRRRTRRSHHIILIGFLFCILGSIVQIIMARRGVLLYHLALLFIPYIVGFIKEKRGLVLLMLLALIIFDDVTGVAREVYYRTNRIDLNLVVDEFIHEERPVPASFDHLFYTAALHSRIEAGQFSYQYGRTFVSGLINWLPRKIFPNKPWTGGPYLANAMTEGAGYSFDDITSSSSMTTGIILESFMNFGIIGVLVILGILGFVFGMINRLIHALQPNGFSLTVWSIISIFSINIFVDDDFGGLINKIISLSIGLFGLYIIRVLLLNMRNHNKFVYRIDKSKPFPRHNIL